jgi:hypothetical protein
LACRLKKEITNKNAKRIEGIFLWQQLQQKQRCINLRNLQQDIETDAAYAVDRAGFIEILDFVEYVCVNWRIMAKFLELQNQAGNILEKRFVE